MKATERAKVEKREHRRLAAEGIGFDAQGGKMTLKPETIYPDRHLMGGYKVGAYARSAYKRHSTAKAKSRFDNRHNVRG